MVAAIVFVSSLLTGGAAQAEQLPSWLAYAATPSTDSGLALWAAGRPKSDAEKETRGDDKVDTEHIFGFTMGSDIGEKGELEFESENVTGLGKRTGSFFAFSGLQQFKYTVTDNFRISPSFVINSNRIRGAEGFNDVTTTNIGGASVGLSYKLIDREKAPFGLTLHFHPGWNQTDEAMGLRVEQYSNEFLALFDKEIIKNRLWGAVNISYDVAASRLKSTGEWTHNSDLSFQAAASYQVVSGLLLGGEVRYVRAYDGLGLDRLKGEALYLGPTFSTQLAKNVGLSGTVNFQVAGKAVGDPRTLDLANFERVQAMLRLTTHF
jgi:hypothetical protein